MRWGRWGWWGEEESFKSPDICETIQSSSVSSDPEALQCGIKSHSRVSSIHVESGSGQANEASGQTSVPEKRENIIHYYSCFILFTSKANLHLVTFELPVTARCH